MRQGQVHSCPSVDRPRACILTRGMRATSLEAFNQRDLVAVKLKVSLGGQTREIVVASAYMPYDSTDPPSCKDLAGHIEDRRTKGRELIIQSIRQPSWTRAGETLTIQQHLSKYRP